MSYLTSKKTPFVISWHMHWCWCFELWAAKNIQSWKRFHGSQARFHVYQYLSLDSRWFKMCSQFCSSSWPWRMFNLEPFQEDCLVQLRLPKVVGCLHLHEASPAHASRLPLRMARRRCEWMRAQVRNKKRDETLRDLHVRCLWRSCERLWEVVEEQRS